MNILIILSIAFVVILAIVESILASRWNRAYFTIGLPGFVKRVDRPQGLGDVDLEALQKGCATAAGTPIEFRRLDADLIAFREKAFGGSIHYLPIMRGIIRRRAEEATVAVVGQVKWFVLAAIVLLVIWLGRDIRHIAGYLVAALAILYLIQGVRFWRIAKVLQR